MTWLRTTDGLINAIYVVHIFTRQEPLHDSWVLWASVTRPGSGCDQDYQLSEDKGYATRDEALEAIERVLEELG